MTYKEQFECIARTNIKRDGLEDLLKRLEKTDFYTAPASSRYHMNVPTGLVQHSINVYEWLMKEVKIDHLELTLESATIVSLFHDICKIGYYKESTRNVKDEKGKWIQVPYYEVDDVFPIGHGDKSVIMLMEFMKLTADEIMAIRSHMGGFDKESSVISGCFGKSELAVLLHCADLKATYISEK